MGIQKVEMLNIHKWVQERVDAHREEIKFYLSEGWDLKSAIEYVLENSCVGKGIKAQIRYEFLH